MMNTMLITKRPVYNSLNPSTTNPIDTKNKKKFTGKPTNQSIDLKRTLNSINLSNQKTIGE